jgi:hypothetical protein
MSSTAYTGLNSKEKKKLWIALNHHHESNRLIDLEGIQVIKQEDEYRKRTAVRIRTADEVSKIDHAEPLLLSEHLHALHEEVCTVDKEKAIRGRLILANKIVARLGAYSHDRVPKNMSKNKLYRDQNPIFTLIFDACTALRSWFRMNKEVVFLDNKKKLGSMLGQLERIHDSCSKDTSKDLLKYGEPITLYNLHSWVTIMHIHHMQLKESRKLQTRDIPVLVPNDLRFEIQLPFTVQGVLNSYGKNMILPGTHPEHGQSEATAGFDWDTYVDAARPGPWRLTGNLQQTIQSVNGPKGASGSKGASGPHEPQGFNDPKASHVPVRPRPMSAVTPPPLHAKLSPGPNVPASIRTPVRAPIKWDVQRPTGTRQPSERVQISAAIKKSRDEVPPTEPVPEPAPAPAPAQVPVPARPRSRARPRARANSDSDSTIDDNHYEDSDSDEPVNEDIRRDLLRGFQPEVWDGSIEELMRSRQPEAYKQRILADFARFSQPGVVDENAETDSEDDDDHNSKEDGDDSSDSDFQEAVLVDDDESDEWDESDDDDQELKAPKAPKLKLSAMGLARKQHATQMSQAGHHHAANGMKADNAKRKLHSRMLETKMLEMSVY